MKLDFRQRLLTTTLLVGASMIASPAFAQADPVPADSTSPPDNSATPSVPETTTPVEGQTAVPSTSAQGENVKDAGDIVITGSRIPQPNLESASPVTVVTSQEVKLSGTTRTEDLINALPQSFAAQGSNVSNGATGTASVNLRGLGASRTLVLVNGRRLQPGDPRDPTPDINFIPSALIKRVDVLTGGASSVYGADAVAGVVNFIMDTNFRGLRVDGQASVFQHKNRASDRLIGPNEDAGFRPPHGNSVNGGAQDISVAFGAGFDDNRGNIMGYATYRSQDPVLQSSRDYSFCALGSFAPQYVPDYGEFYCGGSGTNANGRFQAFNPLTGKRRSFTVTDGNTFTPGFSPFNYAPYNYFQRPDERYTFGVFADYEISSAAKPYLEAMFMNDQSIAQIAPSGDFGNTTTINCDNPLLSAQQLALTCINGNFVGQSFSTVGPDGLPNTPDDVVQIIGTPTVFTDALGNQYNRANLQINRRNVEGGARQDNLEHTAFRIVGGIRGDLAKGLSYDAFYQYGTTKLSQVYDRDFSVTRLTRALDVVTDPNGNIVCRSVLDGTDPNCVPYNVFAVGGVTPEALNYLQVPGFQRGNVNQTVANANVTLLGEEYGIKTPWAERGFGLNVGGEYRRDSLETRVDQAFQTGDLAGQGGPTLPVSGKVSVRELFAEAQLPIVEKNFIEEFTLTAGYRYSDYSVGGNSFSTDTYKIAAELAPIRDVRFRGSYNRAVRAPNVVELFSTQGLGLAGGSDPCAGENPALTFEQCARTGVTAAQYGAINSNPANQYNAIFGGNPNLEPEVADSYTAGIVLQPRFIPGLAVTVDYFDIKVKNLIGTLTFQSVVNSCAITGDPTLCSFIQRDAFGSLFELPTGNVTLTNLNIGGLRTKGIDVNGSYARRLGGMGTLNLSLVGTYLKDLGTDTGANPGTELNGVYDCASYFGAVCGTPNPKWRHKFRAGFNLPNGIGISAQWRYFSKVRNDVYSEDPDLTCTTAACLAPGDRSLGAQSYFDLALSARVADRFNFRLGANNILDRQPPVAGGAVVGAPFGNGNTFPQVYDALGRYLFAGVTVDF